MKGVTLLTSPTDSGGAKVTRTDEAGATLVMVALMMTAIVLIVGLVVDGGRSYAARRQAQNAADSAALAGAQALFSYQYALFKGQAADPARIWAAVQDKLTQNGAASDQTCAYVDVTGVTLGTACSVVVPPPVTAAGVAVGGTRTEPASFMRLAGFSTVGARATSTATIQPLAGISSPFIVCGNPTVGGYNILESSGRVNASNAQALGVFDLQGPKVPDCGDPSAKFKGKADPTVTFAGAASYESVQQGNGYNSSIANQVAGQKPCPNGGPYDDCYMVIPLANGPGGTSSAPLLYITDFGIFHVTAANNGGNPIYSGQFFQPGTMVAGSGLAGQACVVGSQVCVAQLIG